MGLSRAIHAHWYFRIRWIAGCRLARRRVVELWVHARVAQLILCLARTPVNVTWNFSGL